MNQTTRLFITRHGETCWNLEGRVQGSKNSNLTDKGVMQAKQLGKHLQDTPIDIIYTSTSGRAIHTSEVIRGERDLEIISLEDLKEMNMGIWEGLTFTTIREKYGKMHETFWNAPHELTEYPGETFEALEKRVMTTLQRIIEDNEGKSVLIVAHGIVLNVIMGYFDGRPLARLFHEPPMLSTCLNEVEIQDGQHHIIQYAETDHYGIEV